LLCPLCQRIRRIRYGGSSGVGRPRANGLIWAVCLGAPPRHHRDDSAAHLFGPELSGTVLQSLNCCSDRSLSPSPARGRPIRGAIDNYVGCASFLWYGGPCRSAAPPPFSHGAAWLGSLAGSLAQQAPLRRWPAGGAGSGCWRPAAERKQGDPNTAPWLPLS